ncbi:major facilitator superfamily domain-containing protein [Podospora conica]|nr:major facilitator superfamily domain-containing protein [Schizothecium conicum]
MPRHPARDDDNAPDHPPGAGAGEQSPLLNHNPDADPNATENAIDQQRSQLRPRLMFLVLATVFGLELGVAMFTPPSAAIMERILCRDFYPEFANGTSSAGWAPDGDCKIPGVQAPLAMLRGWLATIEAIPALLSAMPWGILSDRWGRKPVMVCGIVGLVLSLAFATLVYAFSDFVPLWTYWFSALFLFLGGGAQMIVAMLYTFIADVTPVPERATAFFRLGAVYLASGMIASPVAGALMLKSPWLALIIALAVMVLCIPLGLAFPETVHLHARQEPGGEREAPRGPGDTGTPEHGKPSAASRYWTKAKGGAADVSDFILGNGAVCFLILSSIFVVLGKFVQELLLQYTTKRYGWSWSDATFILTIRHAASLVTLLVVLPSASWFCVDRLGMQGVYKDLWLARASAAFGAVGCLLVAAAPNGYFLAFAFLWMSLGAGISSLTRSLLNALVEEHHVGTLNSLISFMETTGALVAGPLLAESLSVGMEWGDSWIGLPFLVAGGFLGVATAILCVFRPPAQGTLSES